MQLHILKMQRVVVLISCDKRSQILGLSKLRMLSPKEIWLLELFKLKSYLPWVTLAGEEKVRSANVDISLYKEI